MTSKTVTYIKHEAKNLNLFQSILTTFTVGSVIVTWISSLCSPIILFLLYRAGHMILFAILVVVIIISYLPWKKGLISNFISHFYWKYHLMYYKKVTHEYEGNALPSPSDPQTFYAVHPHGAFSFGWSNLFQSPILSHVRFCFAPALYYSPFFRLFSRLLGKPGSASRDSMIQFLKNGEHLALLPGGFEEATITSTSQDRVFIKKRYGFIRLCLRHGIQVRPTYVFGEKSLFSNVQGMFQFRLGLNRFGLPAILIWGHNYIPFLPKRKKSFHVVVGAPILLPTIEKPTKEEVIFWHKKYINALSNLFEEHKEKAYGEEGKKCKLEVW